MPRKASSNNTDMKDNLLITLGNPNGIGPEITAKALSNLSKSVLSNFAVIGDKESFKHYFSQALLQSIKTIHIDIPDFHLQPGKPTLESGNLSYRFLIQAVKLLKTGSFSALITAPIAKNLVSQSGVKNFTGHTTFLARSFQQEKVSMLFASSDLNVLLATIHDPLSTVPQKLTQNKLRDTIQNGLEWCYHQFGSDFKIGVCGLNPHAGENGLLGTEEETIIRPVIREFSSKQVFGPFPADSLFYEAYRKNIYQLIIAMYHDQGLAPFKLLHFHDGVNVTLGLPFLRTSPDHGTAFSIADTGKADPTSMISAIKMVLE